MEENVVEDFRRHVFGGGHGKLFEVGEEEAAAEVDEFYSLDKGVSSTKVLSFSGFQQNVLGFKVRMDNVVAVDQKQSFDDFND